MVYVGYFFGAVAFSVTLLVAYLVGFVRGSDSGSNVQMDYQK